MQPDVEIYIKDASPEAIQDWLASRFSCTAWQQRGSLLLSQCDGLPVVLYKQAVGKWHSLLFESAHTPWATDLDCAQEVSAALQVAVRCSVGGWQEVQGEADADCWLEVKEGQVSEIRWAV